MELEVLDDIDSVFKKYKNFADSLIENILSQIEEFNLSSQLPHNISEASPSLRR